MKEENIEVADLTDMPVADGYDEATGSTKGRQSELDELCRGIKQYQDLRSIQAQADSNKRTFSATYKAWDSYLKRPTEFAPKNGHGFVWDNQIGIGNPCIMDRVQDIPQEDRLSTTLMMDGTHLDWNRPYHYRSNPIQHSLVLGDTKNGRRIAVQGQWKGTFQNRTTTWWAYTTLFEPRGDVDEWFREYCRLSIGVSSFDEYAVWIEEDRTKRQQEFEEQAKQAQNLGERIASSI
tara:strand:+ start:1845 stop:2549 length:705 start_codon:yes stop_codon:yes gene_type:complete